MTASLGIVVPSRQRDATDILRDADAAMYRAKAMGRNRWALFDDALHPESVRRLALEADLQRAVERQELEVHYQPLVDPVSGRPKSAEALVRWRSPTRGLVAPSDFVPLAEPRSPRPQVVNRSTWSHRSMAKSRLPCLLQGGLDSAGGHRATARSRAGPPGRGRRK